MTLKLLATDFDNTLFKKNDYKKNVAYVNKWIDKGNVFIIVTGRYLDSILKDIKDINLKFNYLICNDGGIIFDNNLNIIHQMNIPQDVSKDITNIYEKSDCLDDWYIDTGLTITQDKSSIANGLIGKFNNKIKAYKMLESIKDKHSEISGYLSANWISITEKSVNKGASIKYLADILNIDEKDVYTMGDNINDLSMANYNFNSFCMTNGIRELKKVTKKSYNKVYELIKNILKDGLT